MPEYPWLIYRMSEGPLTVKEVHQGVNEQLNRKLGTDWGYSEYEWANLLQGFRPLPIRTASGTIAHFSDGADDVPMKSVVANIVPIQSGTGTPSPSNPRPISGTSVLNVEQRGKNLFPFETVSGTTYAEKTIALGASTYTLSLVASGNSSTKMRTIFQYTDNSYGGECLFEKDIREAKTVTLTKPVKALLFYAADTYSASVGFTFEYTDIQLELGNTATTYEPYTGSTYTFDLGQEIMGGTADVVGGVGTNAFSDLDLSSLEWTYSSTYQRFSTTSQVAGIKTPPNNNTVANIFCSHFNPDTSNNTAEVGKDNIIGVSMTGIIQIRDTSLNGDISALMTLLENVDFVYELATPTEYTFTGQPINSYLGVNNVWTDSGEVLDVEYRSNF